MSTHRRRFLRLCGVAGIGTVAGCTELTDEYAPTSADEDSDGDGVTEDNSASTETATQEPTETEPTVSRETKLTPQDGSSKWFGTSVALSSDGTIALVGANGAMNKAGEAYIFEKTEDNWTQAAHLVADDGDSLEFFGSSVALSSDGTTALIGAYAHDIQDNGEQEGAAYVYEDTGSSWTQVTKITADDAGSDDTFGGSVALSGDGNTALIGASTDQNSNGREAGSAYVFDGSGTAWTQQLKLTPDDGGNNDQFGKSVAMSSDGTTAIIGAWLDDGPNGNEEGSAYVFTATNQNWTQQAKLTPDDGEGGLEFGHTAAIASDGSTVLIGGNRSNTVYGFGSNSGSWSQQSKVGGIDSSSITLAGDGTIALIGDPSKYVNGTEGVGVTYILDNSDGSWNQQASFTPGDVDRNDFFGSAVGVSEDGTAALIGAQEDESAYVYNLNL